MLLVSEILNRKKSSFVDYKFYVVAPHVFCVNSHGIFLVIEECTLKKRGNLYFGRWIFLI